MVFIKTYGTIFRIYIPPIKPLVIIADHAIIEELLVKHKVWEKSYDYRLANDWLGNGILTASGNI